MPTAEGVSNKTGEAADAAQLYATPSGTIYTCQQQSQRYQGPTEGDITAPYT